MKTMKIYRHLSGNFVGTASVSPILYAGLKQGPKGIVAAGEVLMSEDMERLSLHPEAAIYCEETTYLDSIAAVEIDIGGDSPYNRTVCGCGGLCDNGLPCPMPKTLADVGPQDRR